MSRPRKVVYLLCENEVQRDMWAYRLSIQHDFTVQSFSTVEALLPACKGIRVGCVVTVGSVEFPEVNLPVVSVEIAGRASSASGIGTVIIALDAIRAALLTVSTGKPGRPQLWTHEQRLENERIRNRARRRSKVVAA